MLLHAVQDHFGHISKEAIEWVATKLELQPINVYELVTFYPMPDAQLRARRLARVARTALPKTGAGRSRAWFADHEGWQIFGRIC